MSDPEDSEIIRNVATEETRWNLLYKHSNKPKEVTIAWQNVNVHFIKKQNAIYDLKEKILKRENNETNRHIIKNGKINVIFSSLKCIRKKSNLQYIFSQRNSKTLRGLSYSRLEWQRQNQFT